MCRDCHLPASSLAIRSHGQREVSAAVGETQRLPKGREEDTRLRLSGQSELPTAGLCRETPAMPAGIPAAGMSAHTQPAKRHPSCRKDAQKHGESVRGLEKQGRNLYLRVEWKGTNYTTTPCIAEGRSSASEQGGKSKLSYFAKYLSPQGNRHHFCSLWLRAISLTQVGPPAPRSEVGAGYGGTAHGQPPWGHGDVRSGCTRWQVQSAEHRLHYFPATKGQFLGAGPIQCCPPVLLDDPVVPQWCQVAGLRLRPPSSLVTIPSDTGSQVFLVSQLTSHAFLKDTPICSCVQKHTPPWYTQPYTARRLYAPETGESTYLWQRH